MIGSLIVIFILGVSPCIIFGMSLRANYQLRQERDRLKLLLKDAYRTINSYRHQIAVASADTQDTRKLTGEQ